MIDGTTVGTATVTPEGTWFVELTDPLADGDHTVTATQTDPAGHTSPVSEPVTFTVDTTADAPVILTPVNGTSTSDTTPTISGDGAEPNATVTVTTADGSIVLGSLTANSDGTWSLESVALPEGDYAIIATQTDAVGNVSDDSSAVVFTVDTTAPGAPVITGPAEGEITDDPTPTISGTGEVGAEVTIVLTGPGGTVEVSTTVDPYGNWTVDAPSLADGDYTAVATQEDNAGNVSPADTSTFTVDATAPAAPVITGPDGGDVVPTATPQITGTGECGATVTVYLDGDTVGTTTVADDGTWTFTPGTPLADGTHNVSATQTDAAGNVSPAADPVTFVVDTEDPDAPTITAPTDGATLGDATPTVSGTGEAGATVTVVVDGTAVGTTVVNPDGTWTFPVPDGAALSDGAHVITATQTDLAGNTSAASDPVGVVVDTTITAPVILGPGDQSTVPVLPTFSGTGEPGATVVVTVTGGPYIGQAVGQAVVAADGTWSVVSSVYLPDNTYTAVATQTDGAGNTASSNPVTFTTDGTPPAAPTITGPADGASVPDSTPTVTGTGEPGAVVTVVVDGAPLTTAEPIVVAPDGTWSVTLPPLGNGEHTVSATQTDEAGNTSPASADVTFAVVPARTATPTPDTGVPPAPTPATAPAAGPAPVGINSPQDGDVLEDRTPTIKGTGTPGAEITVLVDGRGVKKTRVGGNGKWAVTLPLLSCGQHKIVAVQKVKGKKAKARPLVSRSEAVSVRVKCTAAEKSRGGDKAGGLAGLLPDTGAPAGLALLVLLGLGSVGGGLWLLVGRRRRDDDEQDEQDGQHGPGVEHDTRV